MARILVEHNGLKPWWWWVRWTPSRGQSPLRAANRPSFFDFPAVTEADIPDLPPLSAADRLAWDLQTHGSARTHPMVLVRPFLDRQVIHPVETYYRFGEQFPLPNGRKPIIATVAGRVMLRQKPPTANGVLFMTLEDETGFLKCMVKPDVLERLDKELRHSALRM